MNKTQGALFLLGGGRMQIPAIESAHRLGLTVHVADGNPLCEGRSHADYFVPIDLRDRSHLVEYARTIDHLRGVFTAGTDFSSSVAWVAREVGVKGIPYEVALDASNKARMRRKLKQAGVSQPRFVVLSRDDGGDPTRLRRELNLPVVTKPVDNMGARGVERITRWEELRAGVLRARSDSISGEVIVEEQIPGEEYSIDALVDGWGNNGYRSRRSSHLFSPVVYRDGTYHSRRALPFRLRNVGRDLSRGGTRPRNNDWSSEGGRLPRPTGRRCYRVHR